MIKVVLWDIDGTLTDFKAAEVVSIKNCFKKFDLGECSDEMLKKYSSINDSYWQMLERKEISKPELLVKRFDDFFKLYGLECDTTKFNEAYQEELRENVVLNKGAKETVDKLNKLGYKQYVVTNGLVESQHKKLHNVGLDNSFIKVFISDEIGHDKPTSEFFKPVFEEINKNYPEVNKDEIMIIGDSLTSDMQGGINTGIKTCWYNPEHKTSDLKLDVEVDDLNKIVSLIEEFEMEENKEVEKVVIEPKKNHLKDIVDSNYRVIIVCLAAIALLFICLFIGTSSRKNTYALNEITTIDTDLSITLPKDIYISDYGYGYKLEDNILTEAVYITNSESMTKELLEESFESLKDSYEVVEGTYSGFDTYIVKNIYQSTGDDETPIYDYAYMALDDDKVLCFVFSNADESLETEILNAVK